MFAFGGLYQSPERLAVRGLGYRFRCVVRGGGVFSLGTVQCRKAAVVTILEASEGMTSGIVGVFWAGVGFWCASGLVMWALGYGRRIK